MYKIIIVFYRDFSIIFIDRYIDIRRKREGGGGREKEKKSIYIDNPQRILNIHPISFAHF